MEDDEEINYRTLRKIQQSEKKTPFLTPLYPGFYKDLQEYLDSMKQRLKEDKSETKNALLRDEIVNNKKIILNIYEHREKKIVLAAVTKARGGDPDLKNMLSSEKKLFDSILKTLRGERNNFFEKEKKVEKENVENNEENEEKKSEKKDDTDLSKGRESNDNPVIRVIKDMPEFMGTDKRKYFLRKDDVLSIPKDMADMLEKRKAAEKVEIDD